MPHSAAVEALIKRGKKFFRAPRDVVRFTGDADVDDVLNDLERYPHLFVLGCVVDRQIKSENAWLIPYRFTEKLGSRDFSAFEKLRLSDVRRAMTKPKPLHRFHQKMSSIVHAAVRRIAEEYAGDAAQIWRDQPSSAELVWRFLEFPGVGPKIATMATNILARQFKVPLSDYYSVDISVDTHIRRVFTRLGLIEPGALVERVSYRARALYPPFPGLLDHPVWEIGRTWCRPKKPKCGLCYLNPHCPSATSDG